MTSKYMDKNYSGYDHIGINVSNFMEAKEFYNKLLSFIGFKKVKETDSSVRWFNGVVSFSIKPVAEKHKEVHYHRKNVGLNHLAFRANSREAVDKIHKEFLIPNKILTLYDTPKEFPDYRNEYYAVFFEGPDRIKLEVMWGS